MKASVAIITYNQEKFIRQALDSVLMQNVNFDYEIVIGEDCSRDNTRAILIDYRDRYPEKIRLLLPDKNQGVVKNFVQTYRSCRGEYIATLDGDDYWTSPEKLERQVDFLDRHRDFSMCFHSVRHFFHDDGENPGFLFPKNPNPVSTLKDLLDSNFIPTCSVVFRNNLFKDFPEWYFTLAMEDWPLYLIIAQYGKIGHIDGVMGAYRIHSGSIWSSKTKIYTYQEDLKLYQCINSHLEFKYQGIISEKMAIYYHKLALLHDDNGDISSARKYALKYLLTSPFGADSSLGYKIKLIFRMFHPSIYGFFQRVKNMIADRGPCT